MASVRVQIRTCDRCVMGKEKPATTKRTFAIEDRYSEIDLCEQHADAFDRDIGVWVRLASDIDNPYDRAGRSTTFTRERAEDARRVVEQSAALQRQNEESVLVQKRAAEQAAETARLAREAERQAYNLIPGAKIWTLTRHARDRMMLRGFTPTDVLMAVTMPSAKTPSVNPGQAHLLVCRRGDCRVVVDPRTHQIVTVIDRSEPFDSVRELASVH